MSFGFCIANLVYQQERFRIEGGFGIWEFQRVPTYKNSVSNLSKGKVANTYFAHNRAVTPKVRDEEFLMACLDLRDLCFILSFLTAKCITPSGSAPGSVPSFIQLGERYIRPRAIIGFRSIKLNPPTDEVLSMAFESFRDNQVLRRLRLFISHWISGLTCYTLEDIFLSCFVLLDIVKQCEIAASGKNLSYSDGMKEASKRFRITPLGPDLKKMRNDLVHEGMLSGTKHPNKGKADCSNVIADTLNWIDQYTLSILEIEKLASGYPRWKADDFEHSLPSISLS